MRKFLFLLLFSVFVQAQSYKGALVTSMMGATFNPSTLSPVLFINPYKITYVSTVDNNGTRQRGNIIDSATATTGQTLATAGTLASKPVFNGEGWFISQGSQMTTGSVSDYNFIHDGSDFDIWVTVFLCPTDSGVYQRAFICNNGFSTTARGILLRANANNNNRLECNIGNGTSSFITLTANSALTVNGTNIIRVRRSGSNATMFVNGVQVATQTISLAPGVGNANGVMTIGTTLAPTANFYLKDLVLFNRVLTAPEAVSMNTRRFNSITPEPINVYIILGDSNCAGRGVNASIAGDLTGVISGAFSETFVTNLDYTSWAGKLQVGVNNGLPAEGTTQHGAEMRFGKSMGAQKDCFIIKHGRGSHSLFARGGATAPDYNTTSISGAFQQFLSRTLPNTLHDMVHSHRRTPVFRGITFIIGANDAFFANQGNTWTRSGTTATITRSGNHGFVTGANIGIYNSNDLSAIPNGNYTITVVGVNSFTITVPDVGATSGTVSYSGAYNFKQNAYDVVNGIITALTGSNYRNQVTNAVGYTVNKLRIYTPQTKATGINSEGLSQVQTAQSEIGANYLTDNPSRSGNVLGSFSETTASLPMADGVHYTTAGYDTLGGMGASYFSTYINE